MVYTGKAPTVSHTHTQKYMHASVCRRAHTHMHTHKDTRTHIYHTVVEIVFVHFLKIKQELLVVLTAFCRDFLNLMCMQSYEPVAAVSPTTSYTPKHVLVLYFIFLFCVHTK